MHFRKEINYISYQVVPSIAYQLLCCCATDEDVVELFPVISQVTNVDILDLTTTRNQLLEKHREHIQQNGPTTERREKEAETDSGNQRK